MHTESACRSHSGHLIFGQKKIQIHPDDKLWESIMLCIQPRSECNSVEQIFMYVHRCATYHPTHPHTHTPSLSLSLCKLYSLFRQKNETRTCIHSIKYKYLTETMYLRYLLISNIKSKKLLEGPNQNLSFSCTRNQRTNQSTNPLLSYQCNLY